MLRFGVAPLVKSFRNSERIYLHTLLLHVHAAVFLSARGREFCEGRASQDASGCHD